MKGHDINFLIPKMFVFSSHGFQTDVKDTWKETIIGLAPYSSIHSITGILATVKVYNLHSVLIIHYTGTMKLDTTCKLLL